MNYGKVHSAFLREAVYSNLGATRDEIALGPTNGADFGLISMSEEQLVIATDPLFVPRELGIERAAWYAFHIVVSDVAMAGV
ncbi:MAG: hydrogenase expression protein, partial [Halobacteriaceae archaeon]